MGQTGRLFRSGNYCRRICLDDQGFRFAQREGLNFTIASFRNLVLLNIAERIAALQSDGSWFSGSKRIRRPCLDRGSSLG